ncbi:MAG: MGMT family protein [candidate division NC10 bacterium]|nr:MGMT family protein [candidate division NC10 bacterium]
MQSFFQTVYRIVAQIPEGKVMTYGQIARLLGNPRWARTVGWALKANPYGLELPCHRVVGKGGRISVGFANGRPEVQRKHLEAENVRFRSDGTVDMAKHQWHGA